MKDQKSPKMFVSAILAIFSMGMFAFVLWTLTDHAIPVENKDFFNISLMALVGFVGTIIGFHFGSSYGSARKTELTQGGKNDLPMD